MKARGAVAVEADGRGGVRLARLRSAPPVALRWTIDGLVVVAGAGGPLGGDELSLDLDVGAGAALSVTSAAATLVQPGLVAGEPAHVRVGARVSDGGELRWAPQPTVVADSAVLHSSVRLDCASSGRIVWRDVVVLGRQEGRPGSVITRLSVDLGTEPLLRQETEVGPGAPPGWDGPAVTGGHRVVGTLLLVGSSLAERRRIVADPELRHSNGCVVAHMSLEGPGTLSTVMGATTLSVGRALDAAERGLPCAHERGALFP